MHARASEIHRGRLTESSQGVYANTMPLRRSGIWEFRLRVSRGKDVFTKKVRASVLSVPRALGGAAG